LFIENNWLSFSLAQLAIIFQALWLNYLFIRSYFITKKTFVPAYFFILLTSIFVNYNFINIYHIITFLLLMLYQIFLRINFKEKAKPDIFNVGLVFGILVILFPNIIVFFPFLPIIVYALKPFQAKELLLTFIGILCVLFLYFSFAYLFDFEIKNPFYFYPSLSFDAGNIYKNFSVYLLILYFLLSFFGIIGIKQSTGNRVKRNINMLYFLLIGLVFVLVFSAHYLLDSLTLLFIPMSAFLSIFMHRIKKQNLAEGLNLILFLTVLVVNFYTFLESYHQ
jgi:hypothetical protein